MSRRSAAAEMGRRDGAGGQTTPAKIARNVSTAAVATIAAWSSWSHMVHIALRFGERPEVAYLLPALRRLIEKTMREVTKHNVVRQDNSSERLEDLMTRYMRQQLTSAQLIAELVAMAKEVSADARRGHRFDPPLNHADWPSTTPSRRTAWPLR